MTDYRISSRVICLSQCEWRVIVLAVPRDGGEPVQLCDDVTAPTEAIETEIRLRHIMARRLSLAGRTVELTP